MVATHMGTKRYQRWVILVLSLCAYLFAQPQHNPNSPETAVPPNMKALDQDSWLVGSLAPLEVIGQITLNNRCHPLKGTTCVSTTG